MLEENAEQIGKEVLQLAIQELLDNPRETIINDDLRYNLWKIVARELRHDLPHNTELRDMCIGYVLDVLTRDDLELN